MTLWHQSGVNRKGEPFIQLMVDDAVVGQFTPEEARDHARSILEAAEASEQAAFLRRRYREGRGKKGPPSDKRDFMVTDKHRKETDEA